LGLRTLLFIGLFLLCTFGALGLPLLGLLGYMAHYIIGPENQWWATPLRPLEIRYSLTLAVMTAVGIALNWSRLRLSELPLARQEKLMLLFLGLVWFSSLIGEKTVGWYTGIDHPTVKLTKTIIFVFMLTRVVTDFRSLNRVFWLMIVATLLLSLQAYDKPRSAFVSGRLEDVGGVDFRDANFLAAFLVTMLPIIGSQFLRSAWLGKVVCLVAGVFTTNAIILTRSRGAFVALGFSAGAALLFIPKHRRWIVICGLIVATVGGYNLMDEQFIQRMTTITQSENERDRAAQSRIEIWGGGMRMMMANPLGVGAGNYMQSIGRYDPQNPERDAHNTLVRCAGEIGLPGIVVLAALVINAGVTLRAASTRAKCLTPEYQQSIALVIYALWGSLAAIVGVSVTMTLLYVENAWWFLALPVCASRIVDNLLLSQAKSEEETSEALVPPESEQGTAII